MVHLIPKFLERKGKTDMFEMQTAHQGQTQMALRQKPDPTQGLREPGVEGGAGAD